MVSVILSCIRQALMIFGFLAAAGVSFLSLPPAPAAGEPEVTLHTLIAGSGPNLSHNQIAIESNVRYVSRLLPSSSVTRVLFADGSKTTKSVLYQDRSGKTRLRTPELPTIDGPNTTQEFDTELQALTKNPNESPKTPLLLYFTGHGSPSPGYRNNNYDMWSDNELSVRHLAGLLKSLPPSVPVTVIMVQCFSGSFGSLLFQNADPNGPLSDLNVCGFFASIAPRPAAGCTAAVNEADYHDFTGYFFAALSGQDRQGHPVSGADYNHDGRVGMNEAFAYTLIHDNSIDTPVCTSDVFLRRFIPLSNEGLVQNQYSQIRSWAAPAQLAALDALSDQLKLRGEDRLTQAMTRFEHANMESEDTQDVRLIRFVRLAKSIVLAHLLALSSDTALKQRFADLQAAEARSPLNHP